MVADADKAIPDEIDTENVNNRSHVLALDIQTHSLNGAHIEERHTPAKAFDQIQSEGAGDGVVGAQAQSLNKNMKNWKRPARALGAMISNRDSEVVDKGKGILKEGTLSRKRMFEVATSPNDSSQTVAVAKQPRRYQ